MLKYCFPENKQENKSPERECKICKYVQGERKKSMGVFIPLQKINIPFLHNISWKTFTWCGKYLRNNKINELEKGTKKEINYYHNNMKNI